MIFLAEDEIIEILSNLKFNARIEYDEMKGFDLCKIRDKIESLNNDKQKKKRITQDKKKMKENKQITKLNRQIKISKQFKSFTAKPLTHLTLYKLILKNNQETATSRE
jgi:hypothetical protein